MEEKGERIEQTSSKPPLCPFSIHSTVFLSPWRKQETAKHMRRKTRSYAKNIHAHCTLADHREAKPTGGKKKTPRLVCIYVLYITYRTLIIELERVRFRPFGSLPSRCGRSPWLCWWSDAWFSPIGFLPLPGTSSLPWLAHCNSYHCMFACQCMPKSICVRCAAIHFYACADVTVCLCKSVCVCGASVCGRFPFELVKEAEEVVKGEEKD